MMPKNDNSWFGELASELPFSPYEILVGALNVVAAVLSWDKVFQNPEQWRENVGELKDPTLTQFAFTTKNTESDSGYNIYGPYYQDRYYQLQYGSSTLELDGHTLLDILGFLPVVGDIIDFGHGGIYLIEGNYSDAFLSFLSIVPIAGDVVAKGSKTVIKVTAKIDNIVDAAKVVDKLTNLEKAYEALKKGEKLTDAMKTALRNNARKLMEPVIEAASKAGKKLDIGKCQLSPHKFHGRSSSTSLPADMFGALRKTAAR